MGVSRRAVLITGGAAVVIGGAAWTLTREPRVAQEPWRSAAKGFGDPRLNALAYAILAPNPHNMQPWRIELQGEDAFRLFCDLERLLPETDPPNRQITIGLGAFLELFRQAAAEQGYGAVMSYFPDGEPQPTLDARPVASVRIVKGENVERDPLFRAAPSRRTNRKPFDTGRALRSDLLQSITSAGVPGVNAFAAAERTRVEELRELTARAWRVEWETAKTRRESIKVTRIGKAEINENPWGLALSGAAVDAVHATGVLTREKMDEPGSTAYQQSLDFYDRACRSAMAFLWSTTASNTRRDQLEAGRSWVRMHLAATAAGVAVHPLSQALQEYPEMADLYRDAHSMLATPGETVQMLARLGHTDAVPPAPREHLASHLIPA
jgi:hypothetical protein